MLKSMVFKIGDKEIELTDVEAMQLYAELDRLFGKKVETIPYIPYQPSIPYEQPWYRPYEITCTPLLDGYTTGGAHPVTKEIYHV